MVIQDKDKNMKNLESHQYSLKNSLREAEDKNNKYENFYIPKLKDTRKF